MFASATDANDENQSSAAVCPLDRRSLPKRQNPYPRKVLMKKFHLVSGLFIALFTVSGTMAQTVSGSAESRTQGNAQTRRAGASAESGQQTRADVRRNGGKVEANAASQSQGSAEAGAGQQLDLDAGTQINAVLKSTLDSKHADEGQQFLLKTTKDVKAGGRTVIRKGSTLVGHVVSAQSKAEGQGKSTLALMIDGVEQNGQVMPLRAVFAGMVQHTVQSAVDSDLSSPMPAPSAPRSGGGLLGGGVVGGVTGAVGSTVNATTQTIGGVAGGATGTLAGTATTTVNGATSTVGNVAGSGAVNGAGQVLFALSNGVTATASAGLTGTTEFTRTGRDFKLEKGSEFLLAVTGSSQTSASAGQK